MAPEEPRKLHLMGNKQQVEAALRMVNDLLRTAPILQACGWGLALCMCVWCIVVCLIYLCFRGGGGDGTRAGVLLVGMPPPLLPLSVAWPGSCNSCWARVVGPGGQGVRIHFRQERRRL